MSLTGRDALTGKLESIRTYKGTLITRDDLALLEGRAFRAYREFTATTTIKLVFTKPFRLTSQTLWTGQGAARAVVITGGTEGGTFGAMPTLFNKNTQLNTASTTTATVGGTVTGGTEREVLRSDSGTAGGGVGSPNLQDGDRMLAASTYYIIITVTGTTSGMYSLEWVES
jgi:hypothetical protein